MLNSIARDGKLYCLPLLGAGAGHRIQYNPLRGKRLEGPYDFNRFIALCRTIEARGIRSIHLSFGNSELLDTAFGATATETVSALRPMPNGWPTTTGAGAASGAFPPRPQYVSNQIDTGVWKKSDLSLTYAERGNHAVQPPVRHGRGFSAHGPKGVRPHRLHRSVRAHAFLQPRHPFATGPASIWCVISV